ncbi:hypothetical protein [Hymenobacter negativus]|uniref:Uncharacterized protein n=1 Tax=Hymenobacter negativus TaxID=2795026 RepID=A0ABS0QCW5_9BACT|nr:hypothetical protein [Hymenobacter negativus]MBH8560410.1 hypothetical protein [Hymenobacter negativus]
MPQAQDLVVGDAVYYARERAVGLIYTTYERGRHERPGVQLLLSDGRDLSGFSAEEADRFLQPLGDTGLRYEFANVGQLARDYQRGVFGQAFHNAQVLLLARELAKPGPPTK